MRSLSYLKPSESLTEVVSGLIMVLTFTLGASVLSGGGADGARAALVGAIGCNIAWGIIDGVLYMMAGTFDRNRGLRFRRAIASAADEAAALAAIRGELDPYLASVTQVEDREQLYRSIRNVLAQRRLPPHTGLVRDDLMGAIEIFCLVVATALPAVLPLLVIDNPWLALRLSNLLVVGLLFVAGYHWAKYVDANPWPAGLRLLGLGLAMVAIAIPLADDGGFFTGLPRLGRCDVRKARRKLRARQCRPLEAFACGSSFTLSHSSLRHSAARKGAEFSPMPAVNTKAV